MKNFPLIFFFLSFISCKTVAGTSTSLQNQTEVKIDSVAERMLIFQRSNGGWSQPGGDPVNYSKPISESLKAKLLADKNKLDATIDDRSTTLEIKTLLTAYKSTSNQTYLKAAENGIKYLLIAQNEAGGWGQWFPDTKKRATPT